uniref:General transcription factor IIH subunit n=1 Tax=Phlebotomus kandelakii TaxID=1109342 RepID=A0A6B2EHX3_9DIPT
MADEDDPKEYRWETGYEKTWESIKEDDRGLLQSSVAEIIQKAKRKRQAEKKGHSRLGMMRHLYVIVDGTENMSLQDLKPTRMVCTMKLLEVFIEEFFDQNPISQMGFIVLKSKRAEKISDLTGSSRKHVKAIRGLANMSLQGEPSLQNGLDFALKTLKMVPAHASRECLVIMGSLTTCDPTDIHVTIDALKSEGIRCSVISLSAEVRICKHMTRETSGLYSVILDDAHFRDQLLQHVEPPPAAKSQENSLIKMGFPHGGTEEGKEPALTLCTCHLDSTDEPSHLSVGGYQCPQCLSKYCELPIECLTCGLTLVSAPHLARSYHHLFPVARFHEVEFQQQAETCYACQKIFSDTMDKLVYQCETCRMFFCTDCDIFIHDDLHTCVGCSTLPATVASLQSSAFGRAIH